MYFSKTIIGFIPADQKEDGTYTPETWPADAVLCTEEELLTYWKKPFPLGMELGADNGRPVWVNLPPPPLENVIGAERIWRDREIERIKWLRERHRDEMELLSHTTLMADQYNELLVYMQHLRDWPASAEFPAQSSRPDVPEWIATQT